MADEPAQESGPEGGVEHQLEQRQHDGVAVADVETHLDTKITDGVDAADAGLTSCAVELCPGSQVQPPQLSSVTRKSGDQRRNY